MLGLVQGNHVMMRQLASDQHFSRKRCGWLISLVGLVVGGGLCCSEQDPQQPGLQSVEQSPSEPVDTGREHPPSDPAPRSLQPPPRPPATGTVEGTVRYRADSKRPWRYARYYVGDEGKLAEAVVALRGAALRNLKRSGESSLVVIDQKDFRFVPETAAIQAGDRVKFLNNDPQIHNVRTTDGSRPFNTNMPSRGEMVHTFERGGGIRRPIRIGCVYHSSMKAWVFVFGHPFFQVTATDGRFRFPDVPPGEYQLEMAHPSGSLSWRAKIVIMEGRTSSIDVDVSPDDLKKDPP